MARKGVATLIATGLVLLAGKALAEHVPDGSFVRVTVRGGISPFRMVAYDVTVRGDCVVITLAKESVCYPGQRQDIVILQGDEAEKVVTKLDEKGAFAKEPVPAATPGPLDPQQMTTSSTPRYELWSARGRKMERFHVTQDALLDNPDLLAVFMAVKDIVLAHTEPIPMRDLYHSPLEMGYLVVTANEDATAVLDGWERFRLPIDGLEVVEGEHRLRVESVSGQVREFTVRIVRGTTSRYHVVFGENQ